LFYGSSLSSLCNNYGFVHKAVVLVFIKERKSNSLVFGLNQASPDRYGSALIDLNYSWAGVGVASLVAGKLLASSVVIGLSQAASRSLYLY